MKNHHYIKETTLKEMMQSAEERARLLMESCGQVSGHHFMCGGTHGTAEFKFENPLDDELKRLVSDRCYFNILGVNATAAVMFFEGRAKMSGKSRVNSENGVELSDGQEVVVINGESGTERLSRALPIMRSADGRFLGFGKAWKIASEKELGSEQKYIAGFKLNEWERSAALDQAGNLQVVAEIKERHKREAGQGMAQSLQI